MQGIALITGTALGALIPLLYGRLADLINTQQAYWIMVPCYLLIEHFGTYEYKIKSKSVVMGNGLNKNVRTADLKVKIK